MNRPQRITADIVIAFIAITLFALSAQAANKPTSVTINQRSYPVAYDDHDLVAELPSVSTRSAIMKRLEDAGLAESVDAYIVSASLPRCLLRIDRDAKALPLRRRLSALPWITSLHNAPLIGKQKTPLLPADEVLFALPRGKRLAGTAASLKAFPLSATMEPMYDPGVYHVRITDAAANPIGVANAMMRSKAVAWAEPVFHHKLVARATPDDPYYELQWHLHNTGRWQAGYPRGTPGADVSAPEAWDISTGSADVIIGVIDDGIQMNHPDLSVIAARNFVGEDTEAYVPSCSVDPQSGTPWGHGISVAGVAAAKGNNGTGVTGICQNCKIVAARILGDDNQLTDMSIYNAFKYVCDQGAWVVNNSWGFVEATPMPTAFKNGIDYCTRQGREGKGAVVVWATGNDARRFADDEMEAYEGVFAVGASNMNDERSSYSNYGHGIDVVAPSNDGETDWSIVTTDYTGSCGYNNSGHLWVSQEIPELGQEGNYTYYFGGTSSACPLVSGIFGLVLSVNPRLTYSQAMDIVRESTDKIGSASGYDDDGHSDYLGYGRVNAHEALLISGCGTATYAGRCDGSKARWCENDELVTDDCGAQALVCDLNGDGNYRCIPCVPSAPSCTDNRDNDCDHDIDEADECNASECFYDTFTPRCAGEDTLEICIQGNQMVPVDCSETLQRCGVNQETEQTECVCKSTEISCLDKTDNDCDGYTDEMDECGSTECNPDTFITHCSGKTLQTCEFNGVLTEQNCGSGGGSCQAWVDSAYCLPGDGSSSCRSGATRWGLAALGLLLMLAAFRRLRRHA